MSEIDDYLEKETALEILTQLEGKPDGIEKQELLNAVNQAMDARMDHEPLQYWQNALARIEAARKIYSRLKPGARRDRRMALLDELDNYAHKFLSEEICRQEREP